MSEFIGGADADRTRDLLNAIQALSQTELQPHRWRDFSANRIQVMESTDRSIKAVKRRDVVRRHLAALVVGHAFEVACYYLELIRPGRVRMREV